MKKILLSFALVFLCFVFNAKANNILVQNVITTDNNAANKTIQVQFDLSWDNSWRDAINRDAAWVFMKFKDANGLWQHVQLNTTGFANGTGTANAVQVTSDKVGAWVYRTATGSGTFTSVDMQLQWNYGLSGLTSVTGLEVRVYAIEMVYVPQGNFNIAKEFNNSDLPTAFGLIYRKCYAPGNNHPVINKRLSKTIKYNDGADSVTIRIKGDAGIDTDNNGTVDNNTYPIGYSSFYCYKYELSEQQYADFLNTLTETQISTVGVAGTNIFLNGAQYFSSIPNRACGKANENRLLAYADWSGVRPMSFLEFNKASYGPLQPVYYKNCQPESDGVCAMRGYPAWGSAAEGGYNYSMNGLPLSNVGSFATAGTTRVQSGSSYYGILDLTGNAHEPVVKMNYFNFQTSNGDGNLNSIGNADVLNWSNSNMVTFIDMICSGYVDANVYNNIYSSDKYGFRYVRSAE